MHRNPFYYYILVILAEFFWAFSFIWFKMANKVFPPITIVFLRLIISALLLWAIAQLTGSLQRIHRKDQWNIWLLALLNPFLYFIGESYGLTYVSSSFGSVIISLIPLVTPFAAYFFLQERLSKMNWVGIILSFSGVVMILSARNTGESAWQGVLLLLFAVMCAVAYTILLKKLSMKYNAVSLITWQNLIGALLFLPMFILLERSRLSLEMFTWKNMFPILALAVFASSLAFVFYAVGVKHLGASKTNVFSNIMPVVTAIFAYLLLGESLRMSKVVGIIIVITGLFLSQIRDSVVFKKISLIKSKD